MTHKVISVKIKVLFMCGKETHNLILGGENMTKLFKKIFVPLSIFTMVMGLGLINNPPISKPAITANAASGDVVTHSFLSSVANGWSLSRTQDGFESTGSARGMQFLNKNFSTLTLTYASTLAFDQVSVTAATNGTASKTNISISVGGVAFDATKTLSATTLTTYTFDSNPLQGDIIVSITTTNTDKSTYIKEIKTREGVSATGTISVTSTSERVLNGNSLVITPTLGGTGALNATIEDPSIASLSITSTNVTVNTLMIGTTNITLSYGGSSVNVQLEVFEPSINLNFTSLSLLPETSGTVTATPTDFIPSNYNWSKEDPSGVITLSNITSPTVTVTATANLGSATLIVEASDGTTSKQQSILVSVSEITEGKYTISSNSTSYTNPMTISQFNIAKEIPDLDNLTISDISNIRAGASPNTSHISIGGSSTVGGSFKLTLPEGLYATSIKFTGLVVDSGKTPTLGINNGVSFKYASGMTEATLYSYSNTLTITTSPSRIWVSAIEIEAKTAGNAAIDFGTNFLAITDAECLLANVQSSTWTKIQTSYVGMDADVKSIIESSTINNSGNDLEKALGRYEFICAKYGYTDFISGTTSPQGNLFTNKTNEGGLIIIVSLLSITSLGVYYYLRKKRSLI